MRSSVNFERVFWFGVVGSISSLFLMLFSLGVSEDWYWLGFCLYFFFMAFIGIAILVEFRNDNIWSKNGVGGR